MYRFGILVLELNRVSLVQKAAKLVGRFSIWWFFFVVCAVKFIK
jgi:hypothetical protein